MNDKYINVALCFDEKIARYACVTIKSLLDSCSLEDIHYAIHCVTVPGVKGIVHSYLDKQISIKDAKSFIKFYEVSDNPFVNAYEIRNITNTAYFRFLLPEILADVEKVIYLDVDVIVCKELATLYATNMGETLIMGVRAGFDLMQQKNREYFEEIEKCCDKYINSGVMLMNLYKIRESKIAEEWKRLSAKNYMYQDQDIINITCYDRIELLPLKYNVWASQGRVYLDKMIANKRCTLEEVEEATNEPCIVHYAGKKPWDTIAYNRAGLAGLWWKYVIGDAVLTEWFQNELGDSIRNTEKEQEKNYRKIQLLTQLLMAKQQRKKIGQILLERGYRDIAIYGMDDVGKYIHNELKDSAVNVCYGIDQNRYMEEYEVNIYSPTSPLQPVDAVVVTVVYAYEQIKKKLEYMESSIISLEELL